MKMMKIGLLLTGIGAALGTSASAVPRPSVAPEIGLLLSQYSAKNETATTTDKRTSRLAPGYRVGVAVDFKLNKKFSVQTGLAYASRTRREELEDAGGQQVKYKAYLGYLEVPVVLKYRLPVKPALHVGIGAYIAYGIAGKWSLESNPPNALDGTRKIEWGNNNTSTYKPLDVGALVQIGYDMTYKWTVRLQFSTGYLDIAPDNLSGLGTTIKIRNTTNLLLSVGYRLF